MKVGNRITTGAAVMLRQVHPNFVVDGRPSSQVYRPEARDVGLLSVNQEALVSAQAAYETHVAQGHGSCGVLSILVEECESPGVELSVVEAPLSTNDDPADVIDDASHAAIDFRGLGGRTSEKRGRKLANLSWVRGFCYTPPPTSNS